MTINFPINLLGGPTKFQINMPSGHCKYETGGSGSGLAALARWLWLDGSGSGSMALALALASLIKIHRRLTYFISFTQKSAKKGCLYLSSPRSIPSLLW